ncbi:g9878 [Coccomyxa elongata]
MSDTNRPGVYCPEAVLATPFRQAQPLTSTADSEHTRSGLESRLSMPATPSTKASHDSSGSSDPYMHLVDDLIEKGSDYSYKAFEDDDSSSTDVEFTSSDAPTHATSAGENRWAQPSSSIQKPPDSEEATREEHMRKQMDRADSALAHQDLAPRRRSFAAWRQARKNRKEKVAAATAALVSPEAAGPAEPPKSIYTALAAAPASPFDAPLQAVSTRSRSLQPLNSRLDSALEFARGSEGLRVSRSDLMLSALQPQLPIIASPGRSEEEMNEQESTAGSSRSPLPSHASCSPSGSLQRVSKATTSTQQSAGLSLSLNQSPSQLPRADSYELLTMTPTSSNPLDPIAVLQTLCQSVQSLVQLPFVGVSLLEDKDLSSALCVCCGGQQDPCPPIDAHFTEWLLEPQTAEVFVMEDVLQVERFKFHPAVLCPPCLRFYAAVPLVTSCGMRLGSLYIADKQPHELDKEHIPALRNFAKAITKRLENMVKASGVMIERRGAVITEAESRPEPLLVVDTAKLSWQVMHVNSAAREILGDVNEGSELCSLWEMFGATPESQPEGSSSAGVPSGLGEKISHAREFALHVRRRCSAEAPEFTLHFRSAPSKAAEGSTGTYFQPLYIVGVRRGWLPLQSAKQSMSPGIPADAARQKCCGVGCTLM